MRRVIASVIALPCCVCSAVPQEPTSAPGASEIQTMLGELSKLRGDARTEGGHLVLDAMRRAIADQEGRADFATAMSFCRRALPLARQTHWARALQFRAIEARLTQSIRAQRLLPRLKIYVADLDQPGEASKLLRDDLPVELRRAVLLASKETAKLTPPQLLELGQWYQELAQGNRIRALMAALRYLEAFLQLEKKRDLRTVKARLSVNEIRDRLTRYSPSHTTRVPANRSWQPIMPVHKGHVLRVRASGRWCFSKTRQVWYGPDGGGPNQRFYLQGRVGKESFRIGADCWLVVPADGVLRMQMADDKHADNLGYLAVKVTWIE